MTASESLEALPRKGDYVADAEVGDKLGEGGGLHLWSATREDGSKAIVYAIDPAAGQAARDMFLVGAGAAVEREPMDGVLRVAAVDPIAGAYVGALEAAGTLADLTVLDWTRERRIRLFKHLCATVGALHGQGIVHGSLRPENVLLDSDLNPVVANAGQMDIGDLCRTDASMVWLHRAYSPAEVRRGSRADTRADVYALGRILHFALLGKEPDEKDERLPRLDALKGAPNPLIRMIRKCTVMEPGDRYDNAQDIVSDFDRIENHVPVGVGHPDIDGVEESSLDRPSSRPPGRQSQRPSGRPSASGTKRPSGVGIAVEIPQPRRKGWSIGLAIGLGLLGLAMVGVPMSLAYLGVDHIAIRAIMWTAAFPLGLATPGFGKNRLLGRMLVVCVALAALVFVDPVGVAEHARTSGLTSGDPAVRVARFKEMVAGGEKAFRSIDLAGTDLSKMDLERVALDGANLENAKLMGTNFKDASMQNVRLAGADISGANFEGVPGPWMKGVELVKCDDSTTMPDGYACKAGVAEATFKK
jgi:hypothetical protein